MKQDPRILNLKTQEKISFQSGLVFGRTEGCDIQILEKLISRRHASIEKKGDQYFLNDLGSSNGTLLNGLFINSESLIKNGDKIKIGESQFEVLFSGPPTSIEVLKQAPAVSIPSSNSGLIVLGIYFFGKEHLVSQLNLNVYQHRRAEWERIVSEYIENHEGKIISKEEDKIILKWEEASILSRSKALALARTVLLGTRLFWKQYEKEISIDLTQVGVTAFLALEEDSQSTSLMIDKLKDSRCPILVAPSFLMNWEDKPVGKVRAIEGFTDLQELSEI